MWNYRLGSLLNFADDDDDSDYFTGNSRVDVINILSGTSEYRDVVNKIHATLNVTIKKVVKIDNHLLKIYYDQNKELYRQTLNGAFEERDLFHATAQRNVASIATYNLDKNRTVRSKFGKGVSFSPSAHYANTYCNRNVGLNRALILCKVLIGKCHVGNYSVLEPLPGYDTTTGNCGKVYVKYKDNEFYPKYVAYYNSY